MYKSVSTKRSFKFLSEERISELKKIKLKKRSEAKVKWAVNAYCDWRESRLQNGQYDINIVNADLNNLVTISKQNLEYSLCRFVPEVTKSRGDGDYPGKTLYQMIVAIQKFLQLNKLRWKLIHGDSFEDLRIVLDNVMKERCSQNIGAVKKQADLISFEYEEVMWQKNILGEDSPNKLRSTILFLLGINLALRAVDEHYQLRRYMPGKPSQLSLECNSKGVKCVVYREDTCTKTNDGGLGQMRKERKIVWIYPSSNVNRCPVRLIEKYLSLCPKRYSKKPNFYLQSLVRHTPKQWYGREVMGTNRIKEVVKLLLNDAKIDGYFTNHSLRRTGGSRLFQAGVEQKLVKEVTGHCSDALDCYQITSEQQREMLSKVMSGNNNPNCIESGDKVEEVASNKECETSETAIQCTCKCKVHKALKGQNIGEIVNEVVSRNMKTGKTIIKLEIEIVNQ